MFFGKVFHNIPYILEKTKDNIDFDNYYLPLLGKAVLPSRKSDQEISKSDFYQTIFLPKIRPKADPNSLF